MTTLTHVTGPNGLIFREVGLNIHSKLNRTNLHHFRYKKRFFHTDGLDAKGDVLRRLCCLPFYRNPDYIWGSITLP